MICTSSHPLCSNVIYPYQDITRSGENVNTLAYANGVLWGNRLSAMHVSIRLIRAEHGKPGSTALSQSGYRISSREFSRYETSEHSHVFQGCFGDRADGGFAVNICGDVLLQYAENQHIVT
jgi:hypothetical protein